MCLFPIHYKGRILPCNRCAECLKDRVEGLKFRLTEESKNWCTSAFITFTVDEDHVNPDGVDKEYIQRFFKRLRHKMDFKYYLISEYGPNTNRQHYHMIIYSDLIKDRLYDILDETWQVGIVTYGELELPRIQYVANYHVTKGFHPIDSNKNFALFSKGLGLSYLTSNVINYHRDTGDMSVRQLDGYKIPMPKYYKDKIHFSATQKDENKVKYNHLIDDLNASDHLKKLQRLKRWNDRVIKKIIYKKNHI